MKLRIRGNSIRLRLTQSEVSEFAQSGRVDERLTLTAEHQLVYALQRSSSDHIHCTFKDSHIVVHLPEAAADNWVDSELVSLRSPVDDDLQILIEKDFACLVAREGEDDADAFPNPQAQVTG